MTSRTRPEVDVAPPAHDPYALREEDMLEPPTTFAGRLRYLGPGLVISAAVIGSGELITTTSLGAQAGFVLLWLVVISTTIKVWVQLELAQWAILAGEPALAGFARVGPRWRGLGWINMLWILMDFAKVLQRGGIIGGTVAALSILVPVVGGPLSQSSLVFWTVVSVAAVVALLVTSRYSVVERVSISAVVVFTTITIGLALALPLTDFAYTGADLASGATFSIPVGTLGFAIAMFGITGVGADEMTTYTYWVMEKGYGRFTGPVDGSESRARRAAGWIKVMRTDVLLSWIVSTICTLAFYVIGAAILHPQGLVPEGNDMITTLSRLYTDTMGDWAHWLFLVGAIAVLGSTFIASTASVPRLWTHTLGLCGVIDWSDVRRRERVIRALTIVFPVLWAIGFLVIQSPVLMVQIGGVASGIFLVAVVIAVWSLRSREVEPRFRSNHVLTALLVFSSAAVTILGVWSVLQVFGVGVR